MRIFHVTRRFPVVTETFVFDLINELVGTQQIHCTVVAYKGHVETNESKAEVFSARAIEKAGLCGLERWLHKRVIKNLPSASLYKFVKRGQFDLVHCHFAWAYWQYGHMLFDAGKCQLPLLISTHGSDIANAYSDSECRAVLQDLVQRKPDVLFAATTPPMRESLIGLGIPASKIRMIHNAASNIFLSQRRKNTFGEADVFRVVNIGRLIQVKGHKYLIEAFARFRSEVYPNAELNIVGEGPLLEQLQQLAKNFGQAEAVNFLGRVRHSDVPALFCNQHVYVQSSILDLDTGQQETFGVSILEAIAAGLPVIVTETGGMPFLIGTENRFAKIVAEKNPDAIFDALKLMFESRVCNENNIHYAEERMSFFSRGNQVSQCLAVYRELLSLR